MSSQKWRFATVNLVYTLEFSLKVLVVFMKWRDMNKIFEVVSLLLITVGSTFFGYSGKPTEMALIIVAGAIVYALCNIDKFKQIKGAGFEAILKDKIDALTEKETEPQVDEEEERSFIDFSTLDTSKQKVANALNHPEYTWRYFSGIKDSTKLSFKEIRNALLWLVENGFARQSFGKHGKIWSLTEDGRTMITLSGFEDLTQVENKE